MDTQNLTEYFRLSAQLNLQLSATAVGRSNILHIILGRRETPEVDNGVLLSALNYLSEAYGERRRRVGPLAVLHPLRAAALLTQFLDRPTTLDLMTALLHDKLEDITEGDVGVARYAALEAQFSNLLRTVDPSDEWYLMERLDWLTRRRDETYYAYIGRLLDHAEHASSLVAVKLADRLDNTLDLRIAVEDPIEDVDFYELIFRVLFVNVFRGHDPGLPHPPASPMRSAQRLYQLFKNIVLLSLIRRRELDLTARGEDTLLEAIAVASMREAQRTALHVIGYHLTDVSIQRQLLTDVMAYVQAGGADRVTRATDPSPLDGLITQIFDHSDSKVRARRLDELNEDKELILRASAAFIVVFESFLCDPDYRLAGVSAEGISPRA